MCKVPAECWCNMRSAVFRPLSSRDRILPAYIGSALLTASQNSTPRSQTESAHAQLQSRGGAVLVERLVFIVHKEALDRDRWRNRVGWKVRRIDLHYSFGSCKPQMAIARLPRRRMTVGRSLTAPHPSAVPKAIHCEQSPSLFPSFIGANSQRAIPAPVANHRYHRRRSESRGSNSVPHLARRRRESVSIPDRPALVLCANRQAPIAARQQGSNHIARQAITHGEIRNGFAVQPRQPGQRRHPKITRARPVPLRPPGRFPARRRACRYASAPFVSLSPPRQANGTARGVCRSTTSHPRPPAASG